MPTDTSESSRQNLIPEHIVSLAEFTPALLQQYGNFKENIYLGLHGIARQTCKDITDLQGYKEYMCFRDIFAAHLTRLVAQKPNTLLHIHDYQLLALLPLFGTRLPIVVSLHFPLLSTLPEFLATWLKHNLQFASKIIVSTEADATQLALLGISLCKIACIPPMTDVEHSVTTSVDSQSSRLNSQNILCVQRFDGKSGQIQLIKAFAQIARIFPDTTLTLVGKGSLTTTFSDVRKNYFDEALSLCKGLGLDGRVVFCGHVELSKLPAFYQACDIVAHLSLAECFGLAVTEAMYFGKPVIATRVSGLEAQICADVNGIFVNVGDIDATSEALRRLLVCKDMRASYGLASKRRFRELFCSRVLATRHLAIYSDER